MKPIKKRRLLRKHQKTNILRFLTNVIQFKGITYVCPKPIQNNYLGNSSRYGLESACSDEQFSGTFHLCPAVSDIYMPHYNSIIILISNIVFTSFKYQNRSTYTKLSKNWEEHIPVYQAEIMLIKTIA